MRFSSERLQCGFPVQWPLYLYIVAVLIGTSSCSHYPIAEVAQARLAGQRALDADAPIYAPSEYNRYRNSIDSAQQILDQQRARWPWSRDYIPAKVVFIRAVTEGEEAIRAAVQTRVRYRQTIA